MKEWKPMTDGQKQPEESPKDCAVQFYANGSMIEDTCLLTRKEAEDLIRKHQRRFIACCESGDDAEIALWVNMKYSLNYRETSIHVRSRDAVIKNGCVFTLEPAFRFTTKDVQHD